MGFMGQAGSAKFWKPDHISRCEFLASPAVSDVHPSVYTPSSCQGEDSYHRSPATPKVL